MNRSKNEIFRLQHPVWSFNKPPWLIQWPACTLCPLRHDAGTEQSSASPVRPPSPAVMQTPSQRLRRTTRRKLSIDLLTLKTVLVGQELRGEGCGCPAQQPPYYYSDSLHYLTLCHDAGTEQIRRTICKWEELASIELLYRIKTIKGLNALEELKNLQWTIVSLMTIMYVY